MTVMLQIQLVISALIVMGNNQSVKQALVVLMMLAMKFAFLMMVCILIYCIYYGLYGLLNHHIRGITN